LKELDEKAADLREDAKELAEEVLFAAILL